MVAVGGGAGIKKQSGCIYARQSIVEPGSYGRSNQYLFGNWGAHTPTIGYASKAYIIGAGGAKSFTGVLNARYGIVAKIPLPAAYSKRRAYGAIVGKLGRAT